MKKKIVFIVSIILLIQITSYLFVSDKFFLCSIEKSYKGFFTPTPRKVEVTYSVGNMREVSLSDKSYLESCLKNDFDSIAVVMPSESMNYKGDRLYYYLHVDKNLWFSSNIQEGVMMKDEVNDILTESDWESTYIWIFFKWFKIRKVNTGIS